jgi:membrane protein implicated in regulation of membrane protease activity
MDDWVLWLIAAVVFGLGEIATTSFLPGAVRGRGAVGGARGRDRSGRSGRWIVFIVVSVILLAALRPVARRMRRMPAHCARARPRCVGKQAMVLERIANDEGVGCVRIDGEVWTARPTTKTRSSRRGEGCTWSRSGARPRSCPSWEVEQWPGSSH